MKPPYTIPAKLSQFIRDAIEDLSAVEQTNGFKVDMGDWYRRSATGCTVCFAGSVMARRYDPEPDLGSEITPSTLGRITGDRSIANRLLSLNSIVCGDIRAAINQFYAYDAIIPSDLEWGSLVTDYNCHPHQFKADVLKLADQLEGNGL